MSVVNVIDSTEFAMFEVILSLSEATVLRYSSGITVLENVVLCRISYWRYR